MVSRIPYELHLKSAVERQQVRSISGFSARDKLTIKQKSTPQPRWQPDAHQRYQTQPYLPPDPLRCPQNAYLPPSPPQGNQTPPWLTVLPRALMTTLPSLPSHPPPPGAVRDPRSPLPKPPPLHDTSPNLRYTHGNRPKTLPNRFDAPPTPHTRDALRVGPRNLPLPPTPRNSLSCEIVVSKMNS